MMSMWAVFARSSIIVSIVTIDPIFVSLLTTLGRSAPSANVYVQHVAFFWNIQSGAEQAEQAVRGATDMAAEPARKRTFEDASQGVELHDGEVGPPSNLGEAAGGEIIEMGRRRDVGVAILQDIGDDRGEIRQCDRCNAPRIEQFPSL